MERIGVIAGTELIEIRKKKDSVVLRFQDYNALDIYTLSFNGWLFETSVPAVGLLVTNIDINDFLGFRAINQLRNANEDVKQYRQLFLQMKNRTEDKAELIGVFKQYKLKKTSTDLINDRKGMPSTN